MSDPKDPTEETQITDVPVETTRDDHEGFEPVLPDGIDAGKPANPDPRDSQNPPRNRR